MKAIWLSRPGGPEVLEYRDLPTPVPGPGQVLVKAHSIGVNMPEVLVRRGEYPHMPTLPTVPGIEMSGTVVEIGSGVQSQAESTIHCGRDAVVMNESAPRSPLAMHSRWR